MRIGGRRPARSRPSRRRCFLASRRVEPLTPDDLRRTPCAARGRARPCVAGRRPPPSLAAAPATAPTATARGAARSPRRRRVGAGCSAPSSRWSRRPRRPARRRLVPSPPAASPAPAGGAAASAACGRSASAAAVAVASSAGRSTASVGGVACVGRRASTDLFGGRLRRLARSVGADVGGTALGAGSGALNEQRPAAPRPARSRLRRGLGGGCFGRPARLAFVGGLLRRRGRLGSAASAAARRRPSSVGLLGAGLRRRPSCAGWPRCGGRRRPRAALGGPAGRAAAAPAACAWRRAAGRRRWSGRAVGGLVVEHPGISRSRPGRRRRRGEVFGPVGWSTGAEAWGRQRRSAGLRAVRGVSGDGADAGAVGGQRIGHRPGVRVEGALRQPGHQGWDRRRQARHLVAGRRGRRRVVRRVWRAVPPCRSIAQGPTVGSIRPAVGGESDRSGPGRRSGAGPTSSAARPRPRRRPSRPHDRLSRPDLRRRPAARSATRTPRSRSASDPGAGLDDLDARPGPGGSAASRAGAHPLGVEPLGDRRSRGTRPRWPRPWRRRRRRRSSGAG